MTYIEKKEYLHSLAKDWWKFNMKKSAICDKCNGSITRNKGYLIKQSLNFSSSTPDLLCDECIDVVEQYINNNIYIESETKKFILGNSQHYLPISDDIQIYNYQMRLSFSVFYFIQEIIKKMPSYNNGLLIMGINIEYLEIKKRNDKVTLKGVNLPLLIQSTLKNNIKKLEVIDNYFSDEIFKKNHFDVIITFEFIHHLQNEDKIKLYNNIYKSLKNGGSYYECDYVLPENNNFENVFDKNMFAKMKGLDTYTILKANGKITDSEYFYHFDTLEYENNIITYLTDSGFNNIQRLCKHEDLIILNAVKTINDCLDIKENIINKDEEIVNGDFNEAISENRNSAKIFKKELLDKYIGKDVRELLFNNGFAYYKKGLHEQAVREFTNLLGIDSNFDKAFLFRGFAYASIGDYDHAISDFNSILKIRPADCEALYNRGGAYYFKGDFNKAILDWEKVQLINPNYLDTNKSIELARKKVDETKNKSIDENIHEAEINQEKDVILKNDDWICGKCKTLNGWNRNICAKCAKRKDY